MFGFWQALYFLELAVSVAIHISYAGSIVVWAVLCDLRRLLGLSGGYNRQDFRQQSSTVVSREEEKLHQQTSSPSSPSSLSGFSSDIPPAVGENGISGTNENSNSGNIVGHHLAPIVLVHGIFGFGQGKLGGLSYFGGAELKDDRVLVPDLGSLSSLHDRACELFYYMKGGVVDYGEEHSHEFGHNQYGRVYSKGHFPEWDENNPVHFVGHSTGVQVVRLLQTLLSEQYFPGYENSNSEWVASITSLSGALNGTTRVYIDGLCPTDGKTLRPSTLLQVLMVGTILMEWLDIVPLKRFYSWGFDHFDLAWHKVGFKGLLDCLLGHIGPFQSGDWILPDLSLQSSLKLNKRLKTFPTTYYFSYATKKTRRIMGRTLPMTAGIHPLFLIRSFQMSQWRHPNNCSLPYEGYRDEDWQDNDGCLNTISMLYPRLPTKHNHCPLKLKGKQRFEPGIWYYTLLEADHITFILDPTRAGIHFDILYDSIFTRCRKQLHKNKIRMICNCSQVCVCTTPTPCH